MATAQEVSQYLTFRIAGEEFAADILRVREVMAYVPVTAVPAMPQCVRGVINLRGRVVPVVDLAVKFGVAATEVTKWTCIVIIEREHEDGEMVIGVVVDAVSKVIALMPGDIEPPPSLGTGGGPSFLAGLGKVDGDFVLILDLDAVLSIDELLAAGPRPLSTGPATVPPGHDGR